MFKPINHYCNANIAFVILLNFLSFPFCFFPFIWSKFISHVNDTSTLSQLLYQFSMHAADIYFWRCCPTITKYLLILRFSISLINKTDNKNTFILEIEYYYMTWNCISLAKNKMVLQSLLLSSFILPDQHIKKEKILNRGIVAIFQTSFMNNLFGFLKKTKASDSKKKKN